MSARRYLDFDAAKARWPAPKYLEAHRITFRGSEREVHCPCPIHAGDNPRGFSAALKGDVWLWKCRTGDCGGGDIIRLDMLLHGGTAVDACRRLGGDVAFSTLPTRPTVDRAAREAAEAAERAAKRAKWPQMHAPSSSDVEAIAALRSVPVAVVRAAARAGYLRTGELDGHAAFFIREGDFCQARRLDGKPVELWDGRTTKAKTLSGSEGRFIGWRTLGTENPVILVEGVIALLEAGGAMHLSRTATPWRILAAVAAGYHIGPGDAARLAGRHVRIVPDTDAAGEKALVHWSEALTAAGCEVDAVTLPEGVKDIGDVLKNPERHAGDLAVIFSNP